MDIKKVSQKQEGRISKSLSEIIATRTTVNSGALYTDKSDLCNNLFRFEAKTKAKPSKQITLKKEWFDKLNRECTMDQMPVVVTSFGDGKDFYTIDEETFKYFMKLVKEDMDV